MKKIDWNDATPPILIGLIVGLILGIMIMLTAFKMLTPIVE